MIRKNISFSLLANIVRLVFGLLIFISISRFLELEEFGKYIYMLTISAFFTMLIDFGFNLSTLNDLPKNKTRVKVFFYEIFLSKSLLVCIGLLFLFIFFYFKGNGDSYVFLIFIFAAIFQSYSTLVTSIFKAFNRFDVDFYFALINNSFPLVLIYFYKDLSLEILAYIYLIARIVGFIFVHIYFYIYFNNIHSKFKLIFDLKPIFKNVKYAIHMIAGGFFLTIDIPIMKELLGFSDVAIYSAGMKLFIALMMLGDVLNTSFMPKLAEYINKDYKIFEKTIFQLNKIMLIFGILFAISIILVGEPMILLIYGEKFESLSMLLPFFAFAVLIRYFSLSYGTLITIAEKQHIRAYIMVFVFFLHVVFNIIFQNYYGIKGAIISLCLSFLVLTLLNMYVVYKHYGKLFFIWSRKNNAI